jgi:hypothetical protein
VDNSQLEISGDPSSSLKFVNEILKNDKYWTNDLQQEEEPKPENLGDLKSEVRYKNTDEVSISEDLGDSSYADPGIVSNWLRNQENLSSIQSLSNTSNYEKEYTTQRTDTDGPMFKLDNLEDYIEKIEEKFKN